MIYCSKCEEKISSAHIGKVCSICFVGDNDPLIFMLEHIKSEILKSIKGPSRIPITHSMSFGFSNQTGKLLRDMYVLDGSQVVVLHVGATYYQDMKKCSVNIKRWINRGNEAISTIKPIHINNMDRLTEEALPYLAETFIDLVSYSRKNLFYCNSCRQDYERPSAGFRFASQFCKPCWETYKKQNSRLCRLCTQPIWGCYC